MYVGSVRTMVIAGNKGAYGHAEKTSPVKAPLMILGTLPRVLSVTEEVKLPVSVFGGDKNIGQTTVKVEVNGLLQTVGGNVRTLSISKNDEKLALFDLKVKIKPASQKLKLQQPAVDIRLCMKWNWISAIQTRLKQAVRIFGWNQVNH